MKSAPVTTKFAALLTLAVASCWILTGCGGSSFVIPTLTVKGVTPSNGPSSGGSTITVVGSGFVSGQTQVFLGDTQIPDESVEVLSLVELRVELPPLPDAGALGTIDVTVVNPASEGGGGEGGDPGTDPTPEERDTLVGGFRYFASVVTFDAYRNTLTNRDPFDADLIDLNRDGQLDVVLSHRGVQPGISSLLGAGDGTFTQQPFKTLRQSSTNPDEPTADLLQPNLLHAARLDSTDLNPDLAVTVLVDSSAANDPEILVFDGDGDGTFDGSGLALKTSDRPGFGSTAQDPQTSEAAGVRSGDFNEDGFEDLLVAYSRSDSVAVFFGDGQGDYTRFSLLPVGRRPIAITVADLNGDDHLDFAVTNSRGLSTVSVFYGLGTGQFREADGSPFPTDGTLAVDIATGQFNGDRNLDLVVVNRSAGSISILEADGFGSFLEPRRFQVGTSPGSLVVEDLDGNGFSDVAVANNGSSTITLLFQVEGGAFVQETITTGRGPQAILAGEIVADTVTLPDLITVNTGGNSLSVHQNLGDGIFDQPVVLGNTSPPDLDFEKTLTFDRPTHVLAADYNNDDVEDLLVLDSGAMQSVLLVGGEDGDLVTTQAPTSPLPDAVRSAATGDVNGDGIVDLVLGFTTLLGYAVFLGDGNGGFAGELDFNTLLDAPLRQIELVDVDRDDDLDLLMYLEGELGTLRVFRGDGNGGFTPREAIQTGGPALQFAVADFDADRRPDIVTIEKEVSAVRLFAGNGNGRFRLEAEISLPSPPTSIAPGDWNGDGLPDIAVTLTEESNVRFLLQADDGSFAEGTPLPSAAQLERISAIDVNGDEIPDVVGLDATSNQLAIWHNAALAESFGSPMLIGVGSDPVDGTSLRPGKNPEALVDLVILNRAPGTVTVVRNISF